MAAMFHVATRRVLFSGTPFSAACAARAQGGTGVRRLGYSPSPSPNQSARQQDPVGCRYRIGPRTEFPNENHATSANTARPAIGHARCTRLGGFLLSQASASSSPSSEGDGWPPLPNMPSSSSESLEENMCLGTSTQWSPGGGYALV
eukprot:scaffold97968_cov60-Phaeocystis_antarctica.AAC.1